MDQMELNIFRGVLTAMQNYIFYTGKVVTRLGIKGDMDSLREAAKNSSHQKE
jgi:tRNA (cytidine32/uridine32-2'-O)-methyltransferase